MIIPRSLATTTGLILLSYLLLSGQSHAKSCGKARCNARSKVAAKGQDTEIVNVCGTDYWDATKCGQKCPTGDPATCPSNEMCYANIECPINGDPTFWCGTDYNDALTCHAACPSGDPASCPKDEMCYANIFSCASGKSGKKVLMTSAGSDTNWCGTTYSDALDCHAPCPSGMDGECPAGEHCFAGISCTDGDPTNWCGVDYASALDCHAACPYGTNGECPSGESCFNGITSCQARSSLKSKKTSRAKSSSATCEYECATTNYCGVDYSGALDCHIECPGGLDGECPAGQKCFSGIVCVPGDPTNWCGKNWADAQDCHASCPFGTTGECPAGESCMTSVTACGTPTNSPGPMPTPDPSATIKGYWQAGASTLPSYTTLSACFTGYMDPDQVINLCSPMYASLKGDRYITFGGGNEHGYFTAASVAAITTAINANKFSAYEGIAYDIEEGDDGLANLFLQSFAAAKSKNLKVLVTISHSLPYGVSDAIDLMNAILPSSNIDITSPQFYSGGDEDCVDYTASPGYGWEHYANIPSDFAPSVVWDYYYNDMQTCFPSKTGITVDGYIQWKQV